MSAVLRGRGISLLVPFRDDYQTQRGQNWAWLRRFWTHHLPGAQLVIGRDFEYPFSKTCAINNAFQRSDHRNDVTVLLDADCYIDPRIILTCAEEIREARRWNEPLWFVPYRYLYRLTDQTTKRLISSSVDEPIKPDTRDTQDVESTHLAAIGNRFGALIQIMPREAFIEIGGADPRFRGWGGEDVSMVRALDTLYGIHRTSPNDVMTLWHDPIGDKFLRKWRGQHDVGVNNELAIRYRQARRDPCRMRELISEWLLNPCYIEHRIQPAPPWFFGGTYPPSDCSV